MAQQVRLTVQKRIEIGRNAVKKVKAAGFVPGILYGPRQEPVPLKLSSRELKSALAHAASENIIVELDFQESQGEGPVLALIQEVQHHPLKRELVHIDFQAVSATEKVTAEVPIEAVGEPVGVKTRGGLLEHTLRSLEVECLPRDLPSSIRVDVSGLDIGSSLHVRELPLPAGVSSVTDGDLTVFSVLESRVEQEGAGAVAAEAPTAPEVITAKKEDESKEGAGA